MGRIKRIKKVKIETGQDQWNPFLLLQQKSERVIKPKKHLQDPCLQLVKKRTIMRLSQKSKKGNKKQKSHKEENTPSKDFGRVSSPSPPPSNPPSRRQSEKSPNGGASSAEEGELSEDELEQKRIRLLRELQEDT